MAFVFVISCGGFATQPHKPFEKGLTENFYALCGLLWSKYRIKVTTDLGGEDYATCR